MIERVVIDTSTLVSAAIRPRSIPERALTLALGRSSLCVSTAAIGELETVLRRDHFNTYVDLDSRLSLIETIRADAQFTVVPQSILDEVRGSCRDRKDDFILALALVAKADVIVSSDDDLLILNPRRGIQIVSPVDFVRQFPN